MKSKKEFINGKRGCNGWNSVRWFVYICWLCVVLLVFVLFFVGVYYSLMDKFMIGVDVVLVGVVIKFGLFWCM